MRLKINAITLITITPMPIANPRRGRNSNILMIIAIILRIAPVESFLTAEAVFSSS